MVEIKSFPYTFEKIMSTAGKYKLTVSAGFIDEYGNIKVSVDSSSNYDIEVQWDFKYLFRDLIKFSLWLW